jgi:hypothetical protein
VLAQSVLPMDPVAITEFVRGMRGACTSPSRKAPRRSGCTTCWRRMFTGWSSAIALHSRIRTNRATLRADRRNDLPERHCRLHSLIVAHSLCPPRVASPNDCARFEAPAPITSVLLHRMHAVPARGPEMPEPLIADLVGNVKRDGSM